MDLILARITDMKSKYARVVVEAKLVIRSSSGKKLKEIPDVKKLKEMPGGEKLKEIPGGKKQKEISGGKKLKEIPGKAKAR